MTSLTPGAKYSAHYYTSVYKPNIGGWREERVDVTVEAISGKRARVIAADGGKYRGSKRQRYNPDGIAAREIGKIKLVSSLYDVQEVTE